MGQKTALILSGGGARGAYQAGVLKGLAEILPEKKQSPFQIISGVSAGAINGAKLACDLDSFANAVEKMTYLWSQLTTDQVFKTEFISMNTFSFGLLGGQKRIDSLLDTSPLRELIKKHCDFSKIAKNLESGAFESLILTANDYNTNSAVSFVQSRKADVTWHESRRLAKFTDINEQHVMASSAIPMLFSPTQIGSHYYGDGCIRNNTPCSPSIRMGADRLFVIGVRTQMSVEALATQPEEQITTDKSPSMIRIVNTLLNAVLLDSVEQDVYRIQRINQLADHVDKKNQGQGFKKIPALCISPSQDIGHIARAHAHRLPRLIRMTISTLGSLDEASEIISYLLFDSHFCRKLVDMGYNDAMDSRKQIEEFFQN